MGAGSIAPTYRPESLYATEVGSKNELLDRKLRLNGSAFWYEYRDMVLQTVRQISPAGVTDPGMAANSAVRSNVAEARIIGVEADATARLPRGLVASVAGTYLHARAVSGALFDNRVAFGPTGGAGVDDVDISGNVLPRAPTWTFNYSLAQQIRTSIGWFDWIVSAQTRTKYYMTIFNGEGRDPAGNVAPNLSDVVPRYTRVDVGAGYTRLDGKVRLDGYVTNLTDTTYMTTLINTPGLNLRWFNPPRQFGVRLSLYW
jgi:iron complex outermembrane receptor protein